MEFPPPVVLLGARKSYVGVWPMIRLSACQVSPPLEPETILAAAAGVAKPSSNALSAPNVAMCSETLCMMTSFSRFAGAMVFDPGRSSRLRTTPCFEAAPARLEPVPFALHPSCALSASIALNSLSVEAGA